MHKNILIEISTTSNTAHRCGFSIRECIGNFNIYTLTFYAHFLLWCQRESSVRIRYTRHCDFMQAKCKFHLIQTIFPNNMNKWNLFERKIGGLHALLASFPSFCVCFCIKRKRISTAPIKQAKSGLSLEKLKFIKIFTQKNHFQYEEYPSFMQKKRN